MNRTDEPPKQEHVERSATGMVVTAFVVGAAGTAGKIVVEKTVQHLTGPKPEPSKIELPPGVDRK